MGFAVVAREGKKIPDFAMKMLFQSFSRSDVKPDQEGMV